MKPPVRQIVVRSRDRVLNPVVSRLEAMQQEISSRLDELSRRVADMEAVLQMMDGRAAAGAERSVTVEESQARLDRRLAAIEELLADRPAPGAPEG